MQSFLNDLGWHAEIQIGIDANAARSMATRQGIGRVRHLQVRHLWLQALVKAGVVRIEVGRTSSVTSRRLNDFNL